MKELQTDIHGNATPQREVVLEALREQQRQRLREEEKRLRTPIQGGHVATNQGEMFPATNNKPDIFGTIANAKFET